MFSVSFPLVKGRGIFLDFGIFPRRQRITAIAGKPIHVTKVLEPTEEDIERVHTLYTEELKELYDKWKHVFARNREKDMEIVDHAEDSQ
jgi:2-acylglycerol O-acyltransferase 2